MHSALVYAVLLDLFVGLRTSPALFSYRLAQIWPCSSEIKFQSASQSDVFLDTLEIASTAPTEVHTEQRSETR